MTAVVLRLRCIAGVHDDIYDRGGAENTRARSVQVPGGPMELLRYHYRAAQPCGTWTGRHQRVVHPPVVSTGQ